MKCKVCEKKCEQTCGICQVAKYCSKKCQQQDWPAHQLICNQNIGDPVGDAKIVEAIWMAERNNDYDKVRELFPASDGVVAVHGKNVYFNTLIERLFVKKKFELALDLAKYVRIDGEEYFGEDALKYQTNTIVRLYNLHSSLLSSLKFDVDKLDDSDHRATFLQKNDFNLSHSKKLFALVEKIIEEKQEELKEIDRNDQLLMLWSANGASHVTGVEKMIEILGNVNVADPDIRRTLLMQNAIFQDEIFAKERLAIATLLLEKGAYTDYQDEQGNTALMLAVSRRKVDLVRLLLENGADVDLKNFAGETALDILNEGTPGEKQLKELLTK